MSLSADDLFGMSIPEPNSGCWIWLGRVDKDEYGIVTEDGRPWRVHRYMWEQTNGPITVENHVLHQCDNPSCCNPEHLFLGTPATNAADRSKKQRGARGAKVATAKLTEDDVRRIRRMLAGGARHISIAQQFGICLANVSKIANRKSWDYLIQEANCG